MLIGREMLEKVLSFSFDINTLHQHLSVVMQTKAPTTTTATNNNYYFNNYNNLSSPDGLGGSEAGKEAWLESREEQEAELLLPTADSCREVFHPVSISTSSPFHVVLLHS